MLEFLNSLGTAGDIFATVTTVVTVARIVTTATPNTSDDKVVDTIVQVLNALSLAFGKNRVK